MLWLKLHSLPVLHHKIPFLNSTDTEIIAQKDVKESTALRLEIQQFLFYLLLNFITRIWHILCQDQHLDPANQEKHRCLVSVQNPQKSYPSHCNMLRKTPPTSSISQAQHGKAKYCNGSTDAHKPHPVIWQCKKYCGDIHKHFTSKGQRATQTGIFPEWPFCGRLQASHAYWSLNYSKAQNIQSWKLINSGTWTKKKKIQLLRLEWRVAGGLKFN